MSGRQACYADHRRPYVDLDQRLQAARGNEKHGEINGGGNGAELLREQQRFTRFDPRIDGARPGLR